MSEFDNNILKLIECHEKEKKYNEMVECYELLIRRGNIEAIDSLATHYASVEDFENMKKYFELSIKNGSKYAMYMLGQYYQDEKKNYKEMKKYYLMLIAQGDIIAMNALASYYGKIEKNYNEMKKYYLMSIEKTGCVYALHEMGLHYEMVEKDYGKMKQYYLAAIERGHSDKDKMLQAINELGKLK